jgi:hypothetical protein
MVGERKNERHGNAISSGSLMANKIKMLQIHQMFTNKIKGKKLK